MTISLPEGGEMKLFALDWLIKKWLPEITEDDLEENKTLLQIQNTNMFKYIMEFQKMQAKYNPMLNLNQETGLPDTETIVQGIENEMDTYQYPDLYDDGNDDDENDASTIVKKDESEEKESQNNKEQETKKENNTNNDKDEKENDK